MGRRLPFPIRNETAVPLQPFQNTARRGQRSRNERVDSEVHWDTPWRRGRAYFISADRRPYRMKIILHLGTSHFNSNFYPTHYAHRSVAQLFLVRL
jgi:hypothetical protein